jgi:hypothetical protein
MSTTAILSAAAVVAYFLGSIAYLLLRKLSATAADFSLSEMRVSGNAWWQPNHPFNRLLDPKEIDLLRNSGLSKARIRVFRRARRRIFRYYLHDVVQDFNTVHRALRYLLTQSVTDRPDLASMMARQRLQFYRCLLAIHFRLALHACGFDTVPTLDLVSAVQNLQTELQQLLPATVASPA